jgi:CheY-like chemotaxis protein
LRRKYKTPGDLITQGLDAIDRSARIQIDLIEDLLDMGRVVAGKMRLDARPTEAGEVISAAVASVAPTAEAKGIEIRTVLKPVDGLLHGDPTRLQQILWNLLNNAVKFTPSGGSVTVSLTQVDSLAHIAVSDTGQGISPVFLPHVFDQFTQADPSSTRKHSGLGLGLAITRNLVELHGGTIDVASPGDGKGATFTVKLPLHSALKIDEPSAPPGPDVCEELSGLSVLYVDDAADARELVTRLLNDCDTQIMTAPTAEDALRILEKEHPDVIVSDISMPGMDGYELIRRIRAKKSADRKVPAIALTAHARDEDRVKALRAGFDLHIAKPVQPAELMAAIRSLT